MPRRDLPPLRALTAFECQQLGFVDTVIPEPAPAAHADPEQAARLLGSAVTAALVWRPAPRWRISAEWLRVDSSRTSRPEAGFPEDVIDHQTQLSLRWFF